MCIHGHEIKLFKTMKTLDRSEQEICSALLNSGWEDSIIFKDDHSDHQISSKSILKKTNKFLWFRSTLQLDMVEKHSIKCPRIYSWVTMLYMFRIFVKVYSDWVVSFVEINNGSLLLTYLMMDSNLTFTIKTLQYWNCL